MSDELVFNPPPGWPTPPPGWKPPPGWSPDPNWPAAPDGWELWIHPDTDPDQPQEPPPVIDTAPEVSLPPVGGEVDEKATTNGDLQSPPEAIADTAEFPLDELGRLRIAIDRARQDLADLNDERVLQEVGIYRYHHPLEHADAYRERLRELDGRLTELVKAGDAIHVSNLFTYNNSLAQGRKMTRDLGKLMLRAYNAEAENCVRSLRVGNVQTAKKRLETAASQIARLGSMMEMQISDAYRGLRIEEIELTADYLMKLQEEKEAAREERERLREERKAEAELAAERERLDKERSHLLNAMEALRNSAASAESTADLEARLAEIDGAIEQNDYRAANIRAGYVYVISNRGAFGQHVVKIGLTRRLEPMDRIRELGDASVPFPFDIHALFFSDDAVTLENELHKIFADRRVNHVNLRREFFFATPQEVHDALQLKIGALLEFHEDSESTQYLQSRKYWPDDLEVWSHQRA
jgi:hypothetical protein